MDKKKYKETKQYRLPNYDYGAKGGYFITICVKDRQDILSYPINTELVLTDVGKIVNKLLEEIPTKFQDISIDTFVIMPDHIHIIFFLGNPIKDGIYKTDFEDNFYRQNIGKSLIMNNPMENTRTTISGVIRWFKAKCSYHIRQETTHTAFAWQARFNDKVIRNTEELEAYRQYITRNPEKFFALPALP